jgi:peptidoglycan/LPS O-acetylase OafA/YrhL
VPFALHAGDAWGTLAEDVMSTLTGTPNRTERAYGYQPALDGVRALAVTAVLLFHGGVGFLPGGFLGVDAFFVLSGFLITSLLLAEHRRYGRIRLAAFWGRRARRLLPALLLVLVCVVSAGRFLLPPVEVQLLRGDALAALGYVANWRMLYRGSDYFAQTAAPSPLQHTWSLGIEEQFYLLWPLIVVALVVLAKRPRALLAAALLGAAASAISDIIWYRPDDVNRDYFGTDTRAQALLIGCALAVVLAQPSGRRWRAPRHSVLGLLALAGAAGTAWLWTHAEGTAAWLYHGGLTLGALAVAAVIAHAVRSPASPTARLLGLAPLVRLGRISYGVYLWHWPLFQFVGSARTGLTGPVLLAVRVALTLLVATASYHLVERPIREGRWLRHAPRLVPVAAVTVAVGLTVAAVGIATMPSTTLAAGTSPAAPIVVANPTARPSMRGTPGAAPAPMRRPGRRAGSQPRVTVLGDSVAWTLGTYLPPHPGIDVSVGAVEGCGIALLPDILQLGSPHTNYPYCTAWPTIWRRAVNAEDPDVSVILLDRWELMDRKLNGVYQHVGQAPYDAYLTGQLDQAIAVASARGARVVLLTAPYTHRAEAPGGGLYPEDEPARVDAWNRLLNAEAAKHPATITVLDLNRLVCPNGTFTWSVNGLRVRSDGLHFTPEGVQQVIAPWLLPKLAAIAATGEL